MDQITSVQQQNARNMKDFLELYNKLTERCFGMCVTNLNNKGLSPNESTCIGLCVDRYVKFNQRLMFTFMDFQNAKQEAVIKEMEQAAAEGRQPNIPGLGGPAVTSPLIPQTTTEASTAEQPLPTQPAQTT